MSENILTEFGINSRKVKDRYLLMNRAGRWVVVGAETKSKLERGICEPDVHKVMKKRGLFEKEFKKHERVLGCPSLHIVIPTNRCNQKCVYCHSSSVLHDDKSVDMSPETTLKVVDMILQTGSEHLTVEFQGGEATLNLDIVKLIVENIESKKGSKKVRFVIASNIVDLDDSMIEYISEHRIIVSTSLDGPAKVHDHNRRMEGGGETYDKVISGIRKLRSRGIPVGSLMVTTRKSLGFAREIIDEYVKLGMKVVQIKPLNHLGFAEKVWNEIGYDMDEFCKFYRECLEYIIELNKKGVDISERHAQIALKKILINKDPLFTEMSSPCGAVIDQVVYNYDGAVYSCDEGRCFDQFKIGDVDDDFSSIVNSGRVDEIVESGRLDLKDKCGSCVYLPFCGTCPVLNYAKTGTVNCEAFGMDRCKFYSYMFDLLFEKMGEDIEWREYVIENYGINKASRKAAASITSVSGA